ncbi:MAG: large repetitive protein, partial [Actinomycetota bacterium]|nr:large repetitive protein [Actinomycetota bacterium]
ALVQNLDITSTPTTADVDDYTFNVPTGTTGTLVLNVQSSGLSLLSPKATVYAADQTTVLATAGVPGQYGTTLRLSVSGLTAGQQLYVKVQGADNTAFSTGKYALALNFGNGQTPTAVSPVVQIWEGNPISAGGGVADGVGESDDFMNSVPVVTGISQDTGLSTNDGVTNDPTLSIEGQAPDGSTVQVYNNGHYIGSAVAGRNPVNPQATDATTWWFDYTETTLADGTYYFTATATDSASGNVSAMSDPFMVIINTQAPAAPTIGGISADTGPGAGDNVTSNNAPTFFGTASANSQVTLFRGGLVAGSTFADSTGAWTYNGAALADGTYSFTATATDLAGNVSAVSNPFGVTIDTTVSPPVIAGVARSRGLDSPNPTLVIVGTAEAGATIVVYGQGVAIGTAAADHSGNWSYSYAPAAGFVPGIYGFSAVAIDQAGNTSARSDVFKLQLGGSAPMASTPVLINGFRIGGTTVIIGPPIFAGLATAGSVVTILDGDTILGTTTANAFGLWFLVSPPLAAGKNTLFAEATNASGVTGLLSAGLTIKV